MGRTCTRLACENLYKVSSANSSSGSPKTLVLANAGLSWTEPPPYIYLCAPPSGRPRLTVLTLQELPARAAPFMPRPKPRSTRTPPSRCCHTASIERSCVTADDPSESHFRYWHRCKPMQPVRARWKHGGNAVAPAGPGLGIFQDERAVAQQRFDSCPFVRSCDAWPQVPSRFAASGLTAPRLCKHDTSTQYPAACTPSLSDSLQFKTADAIAQFGEHLRSGPQLGGDRQRHLQLVGHLAIWTEEV